MKKIFVFASLIFTIGVSILGIYICAVGGMKPRKKKGDGVKKIESGNDTGNSDE